MTQGVYTRSIGGLGNFYWVPCRECARQGIVTVTVFRLWKLVIEKRKTCDACRGVGWIKKEY